MSDDKLDFSLPDRPEPGAHRANQTYNLLLAVLALLGANFAVTLITRGGGGDNDAPKPAITASGAAALSADALKELAMRSEKQGLTEVSSSAWKEYLQASAASDEESAKIWYRIGKLHQDAGEHSQALDSYYRSESFAKISELQTEIARRTQECLESMGKFAALKYDLTERVSLDKNAAKQGEEVVAEIGAQKITKADLDKRIEATIETQLSQYAAMLSPADRKRQKEQMLKQVASSSQRLQYLQQIIGEEMLYRRARETKLPEDADVRELLRDSERRLLAQQVITREVTAGVNLTTTDLANHYKANLEQYQEPASAKVSHILFADEAAATKAKERLAKGEEFDKLAAELSTDKATKAKKGEIAGAVIAGRPIPGVGVSEEFNRAIFATDAGKLANNVVKSEKGFHLIKVRERTPGRTREFTEVQNEVRRELRQTKERELQTKLLEDLRSEYNVVIHTSQFPTEEDAAK